MVFSSVDVEGMPSSFGLNQYKLRCHQEAEKAGKTVFLLQSINKQEGKDKDLSRSQADILKLVLTWLKYLT